MDIGDLYRRRILEGVDPDTPRTSFDHHAAAEDERFEETFYPVDWAQVYKRSVESGEICES